MKDINEYDLNELLQIYLAIVKVATLSIFISVAVLIPAKFLHIGFLFRSALAVFFTADFICLTASALVLYKLARTD